MPRTTLEDLQARYPPADRDEYDRARMDAEIAGVLSELVYGIRAKAGLTQAELAARVGTTQSSIARMESGRSIPGIDMVARLARAAGVPVRIEVPGVGDIEFLSGPRDGTRTGRRQRPAAARSRRQAGTGSERKRA